MMRLHEILRRPINCDYCAGCGDGDDPPAAACVHVTEALRLAEHDRFEPSGDNHHNAAVCPYCSPGGADLAAQLRVATRELDSIRARVEYFLPEAVGHNTLPEIVAGIALQRDAQHELKDHLAETARKLTERAEKAEREAREYRMKWMLALPSAED